MASRAVVEGAVETMTEEQSEALGQREPCPTCGRVCELKRKPRPVVVRGGTATTRHLKTTNVFLRPAPGENTPPTPRPSRTSAT